MASAELQGSQRLSRTGGKQDVQRSRCHQDGKELAEPDFSRKFRNQDVKAQRSEKRDEKKIQKSRKKNVKPA